VRKFIALLATLFATLGLAFMAVGTASASTTYTATTSLTNRPDSGNNTDNGGNWAVDKMTRVATLVNLGVDPHRPGYDTYSFGLSDTGTFVTDAGVASNPNGLNPLTLLLAQSGNVVGTGTWTNFDVPVGVTPDPAGVPTSQDGAGTPSSDWLAYFFHGHSPTYCPGTGLDSLSTADNCGQETQFNYSYTTCSEHWLDANTDADGNAVGVTSSTDLATIGGISGAACPVVTPTPTPTPTGTTPTTPTGTTNTGVPTGGVQTGGGIPSHSYTGDVIGMVLLLTGLSLALGIGRKIQRNH
jgi:hypothetical protein